MTCSFTPLTRQLRVFVALIAATFLISCGGGGGSTSGLSGGNATPASLSGSVGDGPIVGATVTLYSANGAALASTISDDNASYSFNLVVTPEDYPLTLEVVDGIDLVTGQAPDFRMTSVAMSAADSRVNINPFSTLIVSIAEGMSGGVNSSNIHLAKNHVMSQMNFGLDASIIEDPITVPVTPANIAQIVKASEALGEMIRRTRDSINETGAVISGDDVVASLAADMVDGLVDGAGGDGVDPTVAAVANVVGGQVLVESLNNALKVGGSVATNLMDQAIMLTTPQVAASQLTGSVQVTQAVIDQLQTAISAVKSIDNSAAVSSFETSVGLLRVDMTASQVGAVMEASMSGSLSAAITQISQGAAIDVAAVNDAVAGSDTTASNTGDTDNQQNTNNQQNASTSTTGSATINWTAPVDRADGSALSPSEIGGYRIYYGTSAGSYTNQINVTNPASSSMTISNIPVGTYYFVMTTYDDAGREGAYSAVITRAVN